MKNNRNVNNNNSISSSNERRTANDFGGLTLSSRPHQLDSSFQFLQISVSLDCPHVTIVALHRPHKRNAMHTALWKEIGRLFSMLGRLGDGCRVVLLTATGSTFSAGIDVADASFLSPLNQKEEPANNNNHKDSTDVAHLGLSFFPKLQDMQDCFTALERCPVPIVAAIHGNCIGAGVDLICCADIRMCSADAIFSVREVALGLAADVGTLQRLPKITGNQSLVREACFTGRNFTATEALQMGLVSRVVGVAGGAINPTGNDPQQKLLLLRKLQQDALLLCTAIVQHSPVAVHGTKQAILYARDHSVSDGLAQIASYNMLALQSNDVATAFMRVLKSRRSPLAQKSINDSGVDDNNNNDDKRNLNDLPTYAEIPTHSRL